MERRINIVFFGLIGEILKMKNEKVLSDKYVDQLYNLFENKKWFTKEVGDNSVFDRFCMRMAQLESDKERDFIIELSENYLWIKSFQYESLLILSLKDLTDNQKLVKKKNGKIFICGVVREEDFGKIKSSTFMLYLCQSILLHTFPEFQYEQVRICESPEVLKNRVKEADSIILLDDYIGSGETALECLGFLDFSEEQLNKVYFVSLVAQSSAIAKIETNGTKVYSAIIRRRGISDYYSSKEAELKFEIMDGIEKNLKVKEQYKRGFLQTEGLISMIRTPNNTFPFYWLENKNNKHAPFPRKNNIKFI